MIVLQCEQGSDAWHQARMGIPTASCFDKIISPVKMKPSASADAYLDRLLAEFSVGRPIFEKDDPWMLRGKELEPEAAARYELEYDCDTEKVGFILRDDCMVGASPDRLVGNEGLLEIKCPKLVTHMGYLRSPKVPDCYKCQIQGQLWLAERQWCDFVSFCPGVPTVFVRVERDEKFIEALAAAVNAFVACLKAGREALAARGVERAPVATGARSYAKALEEAGTADGEYWT